MIDNNISAESVAAEEVAGVDYILYVVEDAIVAIGDYGVGETFELGEVVDDAASEKCRSVLERRLVDYDLGPFCLDTFHNALD